ncbi:hypothetical protein RhiXN_05108 [Rhizoctonia solani]|uniref:Uncharacterized protein n=1 Tax=Rhizoctonia solani TaxID=456999 RepID=A0A8H8NRI1_9AGAM|nr:uncharacterized protein RhiXN_05108 [Rhizoctonia solani]QRW17106.1 hypothetical protein RhiXN_05108 [Rhizoctonia solani]
MAQTAAANHPESLRVLALPSSPPRPQLIVDPALQMLSQPHSAAIAEKTPASPWSAATTAPAPATPATPATPVPPPPASASAPGSGDPHHGPVVCQLRNRDHSAMEAGYRGPDHMRLWLYAKSRRQPRPVTLGRTSTPSYTFVSQQPPAVSPTGLNEPTGAITSAATATGPGSHPGGTCPGDGRCDGTGGASACAGCPAFNNNMAAASSHDQPQVRSALPVYRIALPVRPVPLAVPIVGRALPHSGDGMMPGITFVTPVQTSGTAAAEALVAVGRGPDGTIHGVLENDTVDLDSQHKKKRQRKAKQTAPVPDPNAPLGLPPPGPPSTSSQGENGAGSPVPLARYIDEAALSSLQRRVQQPSIIVIVSYPLLRFPEWKTTVDIITEDVSQVLMGVSSYLGAPPRERDEGASAVHAVSPSPLHHHGPHDPTNSPPIPTRAELEKHYVDLRAERARLEDMLRRTDVMLAGVKRGIDEAGIAENGVDERERTRERPSVAAKTPPIESVSLPPRSPANGPTLWA